MPFVKVNMKEEIAKRLENDPELRQEYENAVKEDAVVQQLIEARNKMGLTQNDIARRSGMSQQMVSRIEKVNNSPILRNLIRYVDSLGLEIRFEKKHTTKKI